MIVKLWGFHYIPMNEPILKPIEWVGSSKSDLRTFPEAVRSLIGFALYQAQVGLRHRDVKLLRGLGSDILEIVSRNDGDTFRAIYTVRFRGVVYMLHAFQKKSKRGRATPNPEIDLVRSRLKTATQHYQTFYAGDSVR